ncbi:MAG: LysM peptidoglycan-binding domain-containing protein [Dysgonamonadaceae bacterium]|jgi:LysM repeat protein|nr:LysM peptidoglycan-binding domain-containing protein [Dysgonamonadaceae bacterium]
MLHYLLTIFLFTCLQIHTKDDDFFSHTVEKGQTVYSIASMYHLSVDDIYALNPQSKTLIKVGGKLKIPQKSGSYIYHVIQPKETLYALSKKYLIKGEDILAVNQGLSTQTFQTGKIIRIPVNRTEAVAKSGNEMINRVNANSLLNQVAAPVQPIKTIRVALLLPFGLKENATGENRMIEYYEGFLLALKTLKSRNISIDLQVYDVGSDTKDIPGILKKEEMQQVHLIIGGLSEEQIKIISRFSNERNIPYIIPFTSTTSEPYNNPAAYQVNTPHTILYAKAATAFINKYRNHRIFLVSGGNNDVNQSEFIDFLRGELYEKQIPFETIPAERFLDENFASNLDLRKGNAFVPDDDSSATIEKMIIHLKSIRDNHPEYRISLFGYPRWQTYNSKYFTGFSRLNISFFSVFYADVTSMEVKNFYDTFHKWYSRNIANNFPKFGILGYDMGMYFLQSVHIYGMSFGKDANMLKYKGLQTDFHFERVNNWGGFINTNLFIVNYNPDNSITKISIK